MHKRLPKSARARIAGRGGTRSASANSVRDVRARNEAHKWSSKCQTAESASDPPGQTKMDAKRRPATTARPSSACRRSTRRIGAGRQELCRSGTAQHNAKEVTPAAQREGNRYAAPIGAARRSYIAPASTRGRSRKSNNFKFLFVDGAEVETKVLMRTGRLDGAEGDDRHPRETGFRLTAPPTARRGRAGNAGQRRGRGLG